MRKAAKPVAPLEDLHNLAQTFFKPDLRPPRRVNDPVPPSLAASKLPPPYAEIDERPTWRYRRFKLWRNAVVPLRVAVVDGNRRIHLRRYQSYAIPASPVITRGSFAVRWVPPPTPHPSRPASPAVEPTIPSQGLPNAQVPVLQIIKGPTAPAGSPSRPLSPPKLSKAERRARRLRLLQFQYALDQEHERRFRRAMRSLLPELVDFEAKSMTKDDPNGTERWTPDADLDLAVWQTQFFRDIRKKSDNVFRYVDQAVHPPVPRRQEIHERVKKQEQERKTRKAKKKEVQAQSQVQQRPGPAQPPTLAPVSPAPGIHAQKIEPHDQNVPPKEPEEDAGGAKKPLRRKTRRSPSAEFHGDLTDATTASETSVRTPPSSRPRTLVSSKSAPPSTLEKGTGESTEDKTRTTHANEAHRKEGRDKRHRVRREQTMPPNVNTSLSNVHSLSEPGTPSEASDLELTDQKQLLKDLQQLLAKLTMKVPESTASGRSEVSRDSHPGTTADPGPGLSDEDPSAVPTATKNKRHRSRLIVIRSKSDRRLPGTQHHRVLDGDHAQGNLQQLGPALRFADNHQATPVISSGRLARLADLEERVEVPRAGTAAPSLGTPMPASQPTSSVSPQLSPSPPEMRPPTPRALGSTTTHSQTSFTPVFAELNMDEDTAAPRLPNSRASSVSPSDVGWQSGSEVGSGWSDSLDGVTTLQVSIQDTAEFEEGSIDTAVPVMRHIKEIHGSV